MDDMDMDQACGLLCMDRDLTNMSCQSTKITNQIITNVAVLKLSRQWPVGGPAVPMQRE
jgi:hypothetical protein